jgi:hypothetical protein
MQLDSLIEAAVIDAPARRGAGIAIAEGCLWQADYQSKQLLCLDLDSLELVRCMSSHGTPAGLAWDGKHLWQSVFGAGVAVGLDIHSGLIRQRAVLPEDHGLVHLAGLAWDGESLWCASQNDGLIYAVDVSQEQVIQTLRATAPLGGLAWDGQHLWAGSASGLALIGESWVEDSPVSYVLLALNLQDGQIERRYSLPYWPMGLAWDGSHMWVSDSQNAKLRRVTV